MDAGRTHGVAPAEPDGLQPRTQLPERHPGRFGSASPSTPFSLTPLRVTLPFPCTCH